MSHEVIPLDSNTRKYLEEVIRTAGKLKSAGVLRTCVLCYIDPKEETIQMLTFGENLLELAGLGAFITRSAQDSMTFPDDEEDSEA